MPCDKVSFDRRLERLAPAGEHPRMQIAAREPDLDAVVVAQVIWPIGGGTLR
jgi:hypothetical protein